LSGQRQKLLVCVSLLKYRADRDIDKDRPSVVDFETLWTLIMISAENFEEKAQSVPAVVRSQVFDLALNKVRKLVNN